MSKDRFKFRCYDKGLEVMHEYLGRLEDSHHDQVLMQCTGLRDKNGKLIYEGDVLGCQGKRKLCKWSQNKAWFTVPYSYGEYEIIGNIYQNPDLIKAI